MNAAERAFYRRRRASGMTLIEVMIVIIIVALVAAGAAFAVSSTKRSALTSACMRLMAAARFAYSRSIVRGTTMRVVLDAQTGMMAIEEAHGSVVLARADDARREELDDSETDTAATDPWEAARARLEQTFRPTFGASPFGPLVGEGGEVLSRYAPSKIGDGVRVVKMILPHEPKPRESGRGAIYFFPNGRTEHAVIQMVHRHDAEHVYSVEIHALTGRGRVLNYALEPESLEDQQDEGTEEASEVEDSS